jgi:hypothetical protein
VPFRRLVGRTKKMNWLAGCEGCPRAVGLLGRQLCSRRFKNLARQLAANFGVGTVIRHAKEGSKFSQRDFGTRHETSCESPLRSTG